MEQNKLLYEKMIDKSKKEIENLTDIEKIIFTFEYLTDNIITTTLEEDEEIATLKNEKEFLTTKKYLLQIIQDKKKALEDFEQLIKNLKGEF